MGARSAVTVGRESEIDLLLVTLAAADLGEAKVAVVEGDAGIGKTRLVRDLVSRVPDGTVVAFGHGVPLSGESLSYGVAGDLLRSLVREVGVAPVREALGPETPAVAPLVPRLAETERGTVDRFALYAATQDLLADLAAERLLVLVVEDLHWADESSSDLIAFWARTLMRGRLLLIVTSRGPGVAAGTAERLTALTRLPNAVRIDVRPLTSVQIESQVRALDDSTGNKRLSEIQRLSEGNPLYVEELVAGDARSVRVDLAGRLSALDPEAARIIRVAALDPRSVEPRTTATVAGISENEVVVALGAACDHGILDAQPGHVWRFHHELLRRAVIGTLSASDRDQAHRRWAEHLVHDGESLRDLVAAAQHWEAVGERRRAFDAMLAAARRSTDSAPSSEAGGLWRSTLAMLQDDPSLADEDEWVLVIGGAASILVSVGDDLRLTEQVEALAPAPGGLVGTYASLARLSLAQRSEDVTSPSFPPDELAAIRRRLEKEPPSPLAYSTVSVLVATMAHQGFDEELDRAVDLLADLAEALPDRVSAGRDFAAYWRIEALRSPGDGPRRLEIARASLARSEQRDWATASWAHAQVARELIWDGQLEEALNHARRSMARVPGEETERHWYSGALAATAALHHLGRWHEAEALAKRCRHSDAALAQRLHLAIERDRLSSASDTVVTEEDLDPGERTTLVRYCRTVADIIRDAESDLARAASSMRVLLDEGPLPYGLAGETLALAASLANRADVGSDFLSSVTAACDRDLWRGVLDDAWRLHVDAQLARLEGTDSTETWREVAARWDDLVVPFRAAEARLHWATNLVRADARQEAAVVLGEGLSTAEQLGATWLSDQIRTRAARARLPLAGATQRGPHDRAGLTDREYEVLQLVVTGMTNTQVGDELYMSPKTVSVHVSRILQKLAVANRTELASVAHRRGLVHP